MKTDVFPLTYGDIARGAKAAVEWEQICTRLWVEMSGPERRQAHTIVRAALLRLLTSEDWMQGAVKVEGGQRLEIHISVEMDPHTETDRLRGLVKLTKDVQESRELAEEIQRSGQRLAELIRECEGQGEDSG